jgi:hypothetical protein
VCRMGTERRHGVFIQNGKMATAAVNTDHRRPRNNPYQWGTFDMGQRHHPRSDICDSACVEWCMRPCVEQASSAPSDNEINLSTCAALCRSISRSKWIHSASYCCCTGWVEPSQSYVRFKTIRNGIIVPFPRKADCCPFGSDSFNCNQSINQSLSVNRQVKSEFCNHQHQKEFKDEDTNILQAKVVFHLIVLTLTRVKLY